ncbi:MAG: Transcription termination/antitermination protein NusA [Patescibacteria group bacterium]|nr:Transcription termination/antitermination protein NusA [Patescibacteria group bacterium]
MEWVGFGSPFLLVLVEKNMAISEFTAAINQVASERNISVDDVLETLREALVAAYQKDVEVTEEEAEKLVASIDDESGEIKILLDGKDVTPPGFGRIASQTAKQVILQKIREAEKESIASEYKKLIGTIVMGYIFRLDKETAIMDIGKTQGILPVSEQIPSERYSMNLKMKVLIKDVKKNEITGASNIILSRSDPKFIEELFRQEVPEMMSGTVKIESIAREAGERTKIAVSSSDEKVDPSGACIGQRGVRVQAVTDELNGEKIDIVNHSRSIDKFIATSLQPAHVIDVIIDEETKSAKVKVSEDQLSLAIGNNGQNVRLAAKLTGWKLNIDGEAPQKVEAEPEVEPTEEAEKTESPEETA